MTIVGTVHQGAIVLPQGTELPEGAEVSIEVISDERTTDSQSSGEQNLAECDSLCASANSSATAESVGNDDEHSLNRILLSFTGVVQDLPPDYAVNHDHYLYGAPKQQ